MPELYKNVVVGNHANCNIIRTEVDNCLARARRIFGPKVMDNMSDVYIDYFSRGKNIALASYGTDPTNGNTVGVLQFSLHHVMRKLLVMVKQIIPHEVAHLICMVNGWDMGHGKIWRAVCTMLGGNGETLSTLTSIDGRMKNLYEAVCNQGNSYWLTGTQKRMAASSGIMVENHLGEQFMLTKASLTGNIKAL